MDKRYEDALEKCMERLVKTLPTILDPVLVKMNAYFLSHQQEVIQGQANSTQKAVEFVKTLTTMQNDAFHKFLDVLDQLRYGHLANEIRLEANMPVRELQVPSHSSKFKFVNKLYTNLYSYLSTYCKSGFCCQHTL